MRKFIQVLSGLAFSIALIGVSATTASAQTNMKNGEKVTVKGEVLDMACYMAHESKGPKHASCAKTCVKGGAPMGVLDSEGNVILIVEDHQNTEPYEKMKDLAAQNVSATGTYYNRGGTPGLVLESVEASK